MILVLRNIGSIQNKNGARRKFQFVSSYSFDFEQFNLH